MKICKTVSGERFQYKANLIANTMTAEVRFLTDDAVTVAIISKDFRRLDMPAGFMSPWIHGKGRVEIRDFMLSKSQQHDAREYNPTIYITKQEAMSEMVAGNKIAHRHFSDEWMRMNERGNFVFEDGVECRPDEFWADRRTPDWNIDWYKIS